MRRLIPLEIQEAFTFVHWLKLNKIPHYHIYAGGKVSIQEGAKLKRLGCGTGYPDFCVPLMRKGYGGLYIELKRIKGGVVSPEQKEKINELNGNGYLAVVAKGFDEAKEIVEKYVN